MGCGSPVIYINNKKVRDMTELDRIRANRNLIRRSHHHSRSRICLGCSSRHPPPHICWRGQGLSGHFNTTYSQGHSANANEYMALNYRTGGLDLFVKGYMAQQNSYGKTTNMNRIKGSAIWQTNKNDVQTHKSQRFSGELGFNYEPDEHHSFGLRYMPKNGIGNADRNSSGKTVTRRNDEETDRINFTTAEQIHTGWDHAANAYYAGELGKWNIDFNADYLFKRSHSDQNAMNNDDATVQADSRMRSSLYAAKLVVSAPLWNGRFSFGTEETFTNRHDIFTQNGFSADADDHIKQSVYAAFADYSRSIRHWKLNMGIRYEHQQTDYYEKGIRIDAQSPTYNDIIPVLAASWSHNGKSFSLSYRLRKNNPDYSLLTNSIRYRSKYEYSQGNPLLKTQKTHRFSAGASWNWLYFSAYFSRILNMYTNIIMPYKEDTHPGVLLFATQTIPTTHNYGISFNASPKLGCWEPQLNVNMAFLDMNANKIGITEHRNQPRFYISLDNNFNLPKGWFFNMEGYLSTASRQGFFVTRTEGQINARLSKSFLKNTFTITFTANDILRTGYFHFDLYGIDAYMENRIYRDFQRFGLQVSYKFNATKSKYKGTGAGQSEKESSVTPAEKGNFRTFVHGRQGNMQILFRRRNHKEEHFERLFAEMYPRLVRFATTLMSNTEEAKDIVSETMEQAWKEFDQLKENTRSAWLYATVRNGCLNRLKHLNVEQQHIDRLIEATRAEMNQGYRAHEALLQQAENIARSLPEPTCTILRSCYWEKKTYQQVADELGISPDTVKKHISKALRTLREAILKKEDKQ